MTEKDRSNVFMKCRSWKKQWPAAEIEKYKRRWDTERKYNPTEEKWEHQLGQQGHGSDPSEHSLMGDPVQAPGNEM